MNINASNMVTLIAGGGKGEAALSLGTEDSEAFDFTHALLNQIDRFQQLTPEELKVLSPKTLDGITKGSLQDIAALLGNALPVAGKPELDIDLEETLASLQAIIDHIDSATAPSFLQIRPQDRTDEDRFDIESAKGDELMPVYIVPIESAMKTNLPVLTVQETNVGARADAVIGGEDVFHNMTNQQNFRGELFDSNRESDVVNRESVDAITKPLEKSALFELNPVEGQVDKISTNGVTGVSASTTPPSLGQKNEIPAMARPPSHPDWNQDLGDRILWMKDRNVPFAELRLNPAHLGPVSIRVDMDQDQARIAFNAHHASVRDAIEAAVPRLREMLGTEHINLTEVSITQRSDQDKLSDFGQSAQQRQGENGQSKNGDTYMPSYDSNPMDISGESGSSLVVGTGLLNLFA
ncbi:MAG: flagellar hook-length control protein FliK [Gammaproteobacteria bacterium]